MVEAKLDAVLGELGKLTGTVGELMARVGELAKGQDDLRKGQDDLRKGQDDLRKGQDDLRKGQDELRNDMSELRSAFRENWADFSRLYRAMRDDLHRFEDRVEAKLSQVNQSIQALKDSLERQDFRSSELARRIDDLETRPREPV
jgi:chromosome segregation ATPase